MDERAGCAVLLARFKAQGVEIQEHFKEADIVLDGYDPVRRIGYEYITTAAGDRAELTPAIIDALEARMQRGELYVFLVDELELHDEASLAEAADRFLQHVRELGALT